MVAAEEIGCTPWELEEQPIFWRQRALMKRAAEKDAQVQRQKFEESWNKSKKK